MKSATAMMCTCIAASLLVSPILASAVACAPDDASQKWIIAHDDLANSRVNQETFTSLAESSLCREDPVMCRAYLGSVFDAATAMMLPKKRNDLGPHCFSYATILANEFYSKDGKTMDKLGLMTGAVPSLDADWKKVKKDSEGRVSELVFTKFYSKKNVGNLVTFESTKEYETFLGKTFFAARMMMLQLPAKFAKRTLGGHCFRYAGLMAGEFYSNGKAADALGIMTPHSSSKLQKSFLSQPTMPIPVAHTWVSSLWVTAHKDLVANRVDRQMYLSAFGPTSAIFKVYLNAIFDAATAMMLPQVKTDLGKHCFSYATVLAGEFYSDSGKAADKLGLVSGTPEAGCGSFPMKTVKNSLDADFAAVAKDGEGQVTLQAFEAYYIKKFEHRTTADNLRFYRAFLSKTFFAGRAMIMQLPAEFQKGTLGGHCFRYAGLMAGEFYFSGSGSNALGIHY